MEVLDLLKHGPLGMLALAVVALWRANQKLLQEKQRLLDLVIEHMVQVDSSKRAEKWPA
jgi:hypothetical protein